jgi:DNA-binding MarR family transcriptional regulator
MHAQALYANALNSFASNSRTRYPALVSTPASDTRRPLAARQDAAADVADVAAWRALAASHAIITCALERELGERHGLGVSDFEVLERLAESEDHKFRVQELADAIHLSQSALSRLIGRLEQHGLVERCLCDLDRRGVYVTLTEEGRRRHAEALPTQRAVLAATLPTP